MTTRPIQAFRPLISIGALFALFAAATFQGAGAQIPYDVYSSPKGTGYVAVSLPPVQAVPSSATNEVVFLVDTSASQIGQTRQDMLATLHTAIENLPIGSQIRIFIMDVETEELTPDFVAKGSAELGGALQQLQRRVPMGATDLGQGLQAAYDAYAGRDAGAKRSVVYLGDGRSMAQPIENAELADIIGGYVDDRISINACTTGTQAGFGLVGALVNHTGGNLIDLTADIEAGVNDAVIYGDEIAIPKARQAAPSADEEAFMPILDEARRNVQVELPHFGVLAGRKIADAVRATVVWPEQGSYVFPEGWEVYPNTLQPLRSDRDTVIVAGTDLEDIAPFTLDLTATVPGAGEKAFSWNFTPAKTKGHSYLEKVVTIAAKDEGLSMPIRGKRMLDEMRSGFLANMDDQLSKAEVATKTGNFDQANTIVQSILELDPKNARAQKLAETLKDVHEGGTLPSAYAIEDSDIGVVDTLIPELVDNVVLERSVATQKVDVEVNRTINEARKMIRTNPEGAIQDLRLDMIKVRDDTMLDSGDRNRMLDALGNMLKEAQHAKYVDDFRRAQFDAQEAVRDERLASINDMTSREGKAEQIFKRFKALMAAEEYKTAERTATEIANMLPEHTAPFAAQRMAEMTAYTIEYSKLRHARHRGFLESLMEAERSFIPIPSEPPITYIDPQAWRLLSDRRKERYAVADLSQSGPAEKKISKALDSPFSVQLDESTTFEEFFQMIKDQHPGINIALDTKATELLNVNSLTPVVNEPVTYQGIRLRSALRLILSGANDLTYCIRNEVLLITSTEEAEKYMSIKVYPMADLVVDPTPMGGGFNGTSGMNSNGGLGSSMNGGSWGGNNNSGGGNWGNSGGNNQWSIPESMRRAYGANMLNGKPAGGFSGGFFSVPDEVRREATPKQLVQTALVVKDPAAFWNAYFTKTEAKPETVKAIVDRFLEHIASHPKDAEKNAPIYANIIALVEAAILNEAAQPWMYEALTLSLYSTGAPQKQIERAALSAADFCENPIDMMNLGLFMKGIGLKSRAFAMYKQALEVLAPKRDFYNAALILAEEIYEEEKTNDAPLRWICREILAQEWDGPAGRTLAQKALDRMQALEIRLQREGRHEAAAALADEIREARLRDCVVTIEWTGSAGLDMSVREPTDSVCWFAHPFTTAGGVLHQKPRTDKGEVLGTLAAQDQAGIKRISYVCPRGFNGEYAVILRKEWGDLTNNRVKVAVQTNVIPGEEQREGTMVEMEPEGVIVSFDLENGRRTEAASEGELNVASIQATLAKQQINRHMAMKRLSDVGLLAQIVGGSGETAPDPIDGGSGYTPAYLPYFPRSAVGYRPVITSLSQGCMLESNAVVSADRRYVRISPYPMFSDIRKVYKYNMGSGSTEDMDIDLGGGGGSTGGWGGGGGGNNNW